MQTKYAVISFASPAWWLWLGGQVLLLQKRRLFLVARSSWTRPLALPTNAALNCINFSLLSPVDYVTPLSSMLSILILMVQSASHSLLRSASFSTLHLWLSEGEGADSPCWCPPLPPLLLPLCVPHWAGEGRFSCRVCLLCPELAHVDALAV